MTRRIAVLLGLVIVVVALATIVSRFIVPSDPGQSVVAAPRDLSPAPRPDLAAPPRPAPGVKVLRVEGEVTALRAEAGGQGRAMPLQVGDRLAPEDRVRTGKTGHAALEMGDVGEVELAGNTQFTVGELTRELSRVRLEDGRIAARVQGGRGGRLRVEVAGSDAVAESDRGEFSMLSSGAGQVAVAAQAGSVSLSARARTVQINAGQLSLVRGAAPPSAPMTIPGSLFLKVAPPAATTQRERETVVRGTTSPGAVVSIAGLRVTADAAGAFEAKVPLKDGANTLVVEAEDALGRRTHRPLSGITVDSKPPSVETKVKW